MHIILEGVVIRRSLFRWGDGLSEADLKAGNFVIVDGTAHRGDTWRLRCDSCRLWWKQVSREKKDLPLLCNHCREKALDQKARPLVGAGQAVS